MASGIRLKAVRQSIEAATKRILKINARHG